ncbi:cytochrome P450 monooxygenase-like protein [Massariosphaeria phaeospora]|uniref:Cytochrome P450 monooxygenase-like protein n=1 Tax=Massariosphaeria phaeospora TaxID=100035 RepID=A0A7C8MGG0_9PLEO|nr:cytochrome P450 monooxygenase-like protein [Massariosphaeria phaeospora]
MVVGSILDPEWAYRVGHKPFEIMGNDVFLVVSPFHVHAHIADAEVITQITTRRNDFPKPLELYASLDIYGKNLVSSEGPEWRKHRKLTGPSFGERNNELVFVEAVHHAQSLLTLWTGLDGSGNKTVTDPSKDTMRFALYVISRAGFDIRVLWPHEEHAHSQDEVDTEDSLFVGSQVPPGHKMNYREALSELLHNIIWTQIAPAKYLMKSPFKAHQTAGIAVLEWGKYMEEIYDRKKNQVASGQSSSGMDLFGALIRGSGILDNKKQSDFQKSDLMGNAFVIMLAGHETTANALHFSLVFLAMDWHSQKALQDDIDRRMQSRPIADWTYEEDFMKLFNGMPAAVMNETLRLLQPIVNIPKRTEPGRPQPFTMNGQQYTLPGGISIHLSSAVHRNPKYWPAPSPDSETTSTSTAHPDVDRFRPERWLIDAAPTTPFVDLQYDDEDLRGPSGEDTSAHLFKPVKGSYIPFSDGYRSCIGRRFAQVEILAVLAVIFSQYSVELAVDEFASDAEVERMPRGGPERKAVWQKAVDRADRLLRQEMGSVITLQLRGATIPIRLVRRGEERFVFE